MTQISSQATRQAILVGDSSFDPDHPPANLALFAPDGTILNAETLKGADGAIGPTGLPGINWRGLYSEAADYLVNDGVFYEGSSWRALMPMIQPAAEPSETGALAQLPFYEQGFWPAMTVGSPNTVIIPDPHTAQWRYFDLLTGGDVTFTWDSDQPVFIAPYDVAGNSHGPGVNPVSPFTVTLDAGRVWIDFQDETDPSPPNTVNLTVTLSNGAAVAPGLPWALVAKQGDAGAAGADGADGSGVPSGGTTGQLLAKSSDADGDVDWEDAPSGGGGGGSGGGWTVAQDDTQVAIPANSSAFGPELDITVGASGMALLHVSFEGFNGAGTSMAELRIDGTPLVTVTINSGVPQWCTLGYTGAALDFLVGGTDVVTRLGVMLRLAPGAHTIKLFGVGNLGGQGRKFRLAAMAI